MLRKILTQWGEIGKSWKRNWNETSKDKISEVKSKLDKCNVKNRRKITDPKNTAREIIQTKWVKKAEENKINRAPITCGKTSNYFI